MPKPFAWPPEPHRSIRAEQAPSGAPDEPVDESDEQESRIQQEE